MSELLCMRDVSFSIAQKPILQNIDLNISQGEICTIIGPNGAGKSTLVKLITGLLQPCDGSIEYHGNVRIGYVPQRLRMDTSMPLKVGRFLSFADRSRQRRTQVLQKLRIEHLGRAQIHALSGGELQRVLLARAILRRPALLVLDEPLQGVDIAGQMELYRLIAALRDELDCGIVMVSHDLHLVMAQTDFVVCLNQHICCKGKPENVSRHPEYLRLFGHSVADDLAIYTHHHDHQHDLHGDVVPPCDHHHD